MKEFDKEITDLIFIGFSTGRYNRGRQPGVTLSFESEETGQIYYAIFNVDLHRARNTKKYAAGSPLPDNRFRIGRRHELYRFWKRTGLKLPSRLSSLHDYMGNLRSLIFCGFARRDGKLANKTLRVSIGQHNSISDEEWHPDSPIASNYERDGNTQAPDSSHATSRHLPSNGHTVMPNKECAETPFSSSFANDLSACGFKYELGQQGSRSKDSKAVEDQTNEEWLKDYNSPGPWDNDKPRPDDYEDIPF